jgi:uncharacterized tellurite resistance protein B-like protein
VPTDFLSLFTLLNTSGARYVLVGGLAVLMHGVDRVTADVDLVVDLAPEAAAAVIGALTASGYRAMAPVDPEQFADAAVRAGRQATNRMQVFSLWDANSQRPTVDILLSPVEFETLWREAEIIRYRGINIRVASTPYDVTGRSETAEPPPGWGRFEDAEALRRWSFLQRTPEQRLEWLIQMLEIAYARGAIQPRRPGQPGNAG